MTTDTLNPSRIGWRLPRLHGLPWVTWRQHRTGLTATLAFFTGVAVLLVVHGLAMHAAYHRLGLDTCGDLRGPACQAPFTVFRDRYGLWPDALAMSLAFVPAIIGVFLGGPLVAREWDAGTYRFAWTQGRSRSRWLAVKLAILGGTLTLAALAFSALFAWWYRPWVPVQGRLGTNANEVLGPIFAARILFCFTISAFLGMLVRRTVPAMAAAMVASLAAILAPAIWLRPLLQKPLVANTDTNPSANTGMVIDQWVTDPGGHRLTSAQTDNLDIQAGPDLVNRHISFHTWLTDHHYTSWVSYQPDSRFWHFQTIETAGYLILALILAAAAIQWMRRPVL